MKIQNLIIAVAVIGLGVWAYNKYGKKEESKTSNCCGA